MANIKKIADRASEIMGEKGSTAPYAVGQACKELGGWGDDYSQTLKELGRRAVEHHRVMKRVPHIPKRVHQPPIMRFAHSLDSFLNRADIYS